MVVPDPAVRVFSELSPSFQTTVGSVRVEATQDRVTRDPCTTPSEVGDVVIPGGGRGLFSGGLFSGGGVYLMGVYLVGGLFSFLQLL